MGTAGATLLVFGAVVIVVGTIIEDVLMLGAGVVDDPASFAIATAMVVAAHQLFRLYAMNLLRRVSTQMVSAAVMVLAPPIAIAKSTGLLEDAK